MKKAILVLIIVIAVLVVVAGIFAYLFYSGRHGPQDNFLLSQSQIDEVTSFFSLSPSFDEISNYCDKNRAYCFYYCRDINSEDEYCKEIMNFTRGPGMQGGGELSQPPK